MAKLLTGIGSMSKKSKSEHFGQFYIFIKVQRPSHCVSCLSPNAFAASEKINLEQPRQHEAVS